MDEGEAMRARFCGGERELSVWPLVPAPVSRVAAAPVSVEERRGCERIRSSAAAGAAALAGCPKVCGAWRTSGRRRIGPPRVPGRASSLSSELLDEDDESVP